MRVYQGLAVVSTSLLLGMLVSVGVCDNESYASISNQEVSTNSDAGKYEEEKVYALEDLLLDVKVCHTDGSLVASENSISNNDRSLLLKLDYKLNDIMQKELYKRQELILTYSLTKSVQDIIDNYDSLVGESWEFQDNGNEPSYQAEFCDGYKVKINLLSDSSYICDGIYTIDVELPLSDNLQDVFTRLDFKIGGKKVSKELWCDRVQDNVIADEEYGLEYKIVKDEVEDYIIVTGLSKEVEDLVIPSVIDNIKVKSIAYEAFKDSNIETVSLDEGLDYIGNGAFSYCKYVREIIIPDSVTYIGASVFAGCSSLESVILSSNLQKLEYHIFADLANLKQIYIPDSVIEIAMLSFADTYGFDIYYEGTEDDWSAIDISNAQQKLSIYGFKDVVIHYDADKTMTDNSFMGSSIGAKSTFSKGTNTGNGSIGGSGRSADKADDLPDYVVRGTWTYDESGNWRFSDTADTEFTNTWVAAYNPYAEKEKGQKEYDWFHFDNIGSMQTGWLMGDNGETYYLNTVKDGTYGAMLTGWQCIDGQWYYFNRNGVLEENILIDR